MEKSLIAKLCEQLQTEGSIELTKEELESLLSVSELLAQLETLELWCPDQRQLVEEIKEKLERLSKGKHFEGFIELKEKYLFI